MLFPSTVVWLWQCGCDSVAVVHSVVIRAVRPCVWIASIRSRFFLSPVLYFCSWFTLSFVFVCFSVVCCFVAFYFVVLFACLFLFDSVCFCLIPFVSVFSVCFCLFLLVFVCLIFVCLCFYALVLLCCCVLYCFVAFGLRCFGLVCFVLLPVRFIC